MLGVSLLLPILDLVAIMDAMQFIQIYKLSFIFPFIMASMTSKLLVSLIYFYINLYIDVCLLIIDLNF